MTTIDTTKPVLVTGATGYVAGWIVKELLDAGATVHAPVRDPSNPEKLKHLNALADASPGRIVYFKADLLTPGSYAEAMERCGVVFHTASPFTINVKDAQRDLIDPAVKGTRNVLEEAKKTPTVARVVVTSSCAAIYTDAADCAAAPNGVLTEEVWNTTASLDYQPYSYSKTLAEKEAWSVAETQDQWDLVCVNPSFVLGPSIGGIPTSESFSVIKQMGDGTMKMGAPRMGIGVVDVRDLARAHIAAGFKPEANGRNIISGHNSNFLEIGLAGRDRFGATLPLPKGPMPKWLVWLIGPMVGMSRKMVTNNVNVLWKADNAKGMRELGVTYRPINETVGDMLEQMVAQNAFAK